MLRLDHVLYAVRDLDAAAARMFDEHGLASVAGGVHPRWGTGNRVVPFADGTYLELIAVIDAAVARATRLGSAVAQAVDRGDRWFAMCVSDDDLERTAARLGLEVSAGSRTLPDGTDVAWRSAGIEDPRRSAALPFFIRWDGPADAHPSAMPAEHPSGATGIALVEVAGDPAAFRAWTGGAALPVAVSEGTAAIAAVTLVTPDGDRRVA